MNRRTPAEGPSRRLQDRLAQGESDAFAEAYDLYGERLYRCARWWSGGGDEAEDLVQELFVALVRGSARLREVEDLPSYLFVALRRLALRAAQKRLRGGRQSSLGDEAERIAARTEAVGELCERREQLAAALRTLPESQREVVVLKVDGELTFEQIGATLSISANTAASRYRYALERLRGLLSEPERARAEGE
ncbi:MAG: sigma-70 family RNA polymerase sigma factor [Pirellulales bacterium]